MLVPGVLAGSAGAAVTPQAAVGCNGVLVHGTPSIDDTNPIDYQFHCNGDITAYTLTVTRQPYDFTEVDNFSTTANVVDGAGNPVPTESFGCEGSIPGAGINCNGTATVGHYVRGSFDTTDPYCANIPPGSPPGTQPEPQAMVQLIVSDTTGAEDGPFRLNITPTCPVVKATPKTKPKTKAKRTSHHKHHHTAGRK
jgi:hypothetical protein